MTVEHDTECYNRIRFAMDDADGSLRFRRIGVEGGAFCEGVLKRLEAYLRERPLAEVSLDAVRSIAAECRPACGRELARTIAAQKRFFCGADGSEKDTEG